MNPVLAHSGPYDDVVLPGVEEVEADVVLPELSGHTIRQIDLAGTCLERLAESMGAEKAECIAFSDLQSRR